MRVATLCGSLHSGSTNAVVLTTIANRLTRAGATVQPVDTSIDVASFRPEAIDDPPKAVPAIRSTSPGAPTSLGIDPSDRLG